jgi:putative alpha-1,2-mannosidase
LARYGVDEVAHSPGNAGGLAAQARRGYAALGGREALVLKLDALFSTPLDTKAAGLPDDVSGLVGQYAHGNEPSHHVAYLYTYAGAPWKTQERVRQVLDTLYGDTPDGLPGNEDCGQMSAWYVLSALGLYPSTRRARPTSSRARSSIGRRWSSARAGASP